MKRFSLLLVACVAALSAHAIYLNGVDYRIDTLSMFPAGPGATMFELRMNKTAGAGGRLDCWLLTVDTDHPNISIEQVLGSGKLIGTERPSSMAKRKSTDTKVYFAGTNGDFFVTQGDVGRPIGLTIANNEYCYTPNNNRLIGAVDEQFHGLLGTLGRFSGKLVLADTTLNIHHVNYKREENQLVLYNQHNAATTLTNAYGTELLIELLPGKEWHTSATLQAKITDKQVNIGSMAIPAGQAVLSGHGTMADMLNTLNIGDTVTLNLQLKIDDQVVNASNCVGSDNYALILNNGEVEQSNFWNEKHPRTAFGASENGHVLYFLVVDGRGVSEGCTTKVLAEILQHFGAYKAVNWDGGGSSCMYLNPFGPMNNGSDGQERACGNGMFVVANVPGPDTTVASIAARNPICILPRYGMAAPSFLGYNQYGLIVNTEVEGVVLSCDSSVGEILPDGSFFATGANGGVLHATLGNSTTDLTVRIIDSAPISIRLDSVLRDHIHPYTIEVQAKINGSPVNLHAGALSWESLQPEVATVSDLGAVIGVSNGYADIIGTLGEFADTIRVHVEMPEHHEQMWSDFREPARWELKASSGFNPILVVPDDTLAPVDLQFTYKSARGPYIRLGNTEPLYSLPDTVRVAFRTDAVVEKITVGIRPCNLTASASYVSTQTFTQGERTIVDISINDLVGNDPAIFPLFFDYLRFPIETTTTDGLHHIWLDGISLIYKDITDPVSALDQLPAGARVKKLQDGQVIITIAGRTYNAQGQRID